MAVHTLRQYLARMSREHTTDLDVDLLGQEITLCEVRLRNHTACETTLLAKQIRLREATVTTHFPRQPLIPVAWARRSAVRGVVSKGGAHPATPVSRF